MNPDLVTLNLHRKKEKTTSQCVWPSLDLLLSAPFAFSRPGELFCGLRSFNRNKKSQFDKEL